MTKQTRLRKLVGRKIVRAVVFEESDRGVVTLEIETDDGQVFDFFTDPQPAHMRLAAYRTNNDDGREYVFTSDTKG